MGRPRTPTALLELRGSFKHDPKRKSQRIGEPKPSGPLGEAPPSFTPALIEIWLELIELAPTGVLGNADRWITELTCQLMLKFRTVGLIPGVGMTGAELNLLVSCLGRMGMTPSDRSKVGIPTNKETAAAGDDLAELARESRALLRFTH